MDTRWIALSLSVLLTVSAGDLSYNVGIYDFDDNLLVTDATINLQCNHSGEWIDKNLTTAEWRDFHSTDWQKSCRYRTDVDSFRDFSDELGLHVFEEQARCRVPSDNLLAAGLPASIVTARGHSPTAISFGFLALLSKGFNEDQRRAAVAGFVNGTAQTLYGMKNSAAYYSPLFASESSVLQLLTDASKMVPVINPVWNARHGHCTTANCKALAIKQITQDQVTLESRDDDPANQRAVIALFCNDLAHEFDNVCFRVYNTTIRTARPVVYDLTAACKTSQPGAPVDTPSFEASCGSDHWDHKSARFSESL